ncbi:MAG: hypothetical protein LBL94_08005 [Prevotellaceae bacterium]|jgi:hypothetical protein|nr:hypothetical protein [Prevotellaceae bacterium]
MKKAEEIELDFVIDSGVLSDADREEISCYIREYRQLDILPATNRQLFVRQE